MNRFLQSRAGARHLSACARYALALLVFVGVFCEANLAHAYPWMIRHDYTSCATCHVDPSGAGVLTEYGSAQGDILLRTHYGKATTDDVSSTAGFLWGATHPPAWFLPGGSLRTLFYYDKLGSHSEFNFVLMQADVQAAIVKGHFRAYGSVGVAGSDGSAAAITGPLVARQYWLGWAFGADDALLLRAGRIDIPFGIRQIEHTLFVRESTRSDLNDTQQLGAALAYSGGMFRAELMAIAGNYQVSPDVYRERGYSGYFEVAPLANAAFGVSSLVTHAARDRDLNLPNTRQAHGVFARVAPVEPLALLAEADLIVQSATAATGYATMLQADVEPVQGLHLIATGEDRRVGGTNTATSWSGWLGADWFFAPHADARLDFQKRSLAAGTTHTPETAIMMQFHVYL